MIAERLHVLERPPEGRPLLVRDGEDERIGPLFLSYGRLVLVCGACSFILIEGAPDSGMLRDAVMQCPCCGSYNETWDAAASDGRSPGVPAWRPGLLDGFPGRLC